MGLSVLCFALLASAEQWPERVGALARGTWAVVAFIGRPCGAAYFAWLYALKHASSTRVRVFVALSPVTASEQGTVLDETVKAFLFAALALNGV